MPVLGAEDVAEEHPATWPRSRAATSHGSCAAQADHSGPWTPGSGLFQGLGFQ